MPKTTKKKPMSKAAAAALKAMENVISMAEDIDVHIEQVRERLRAAGISSEVGTILGAGRHTSGSCIVSVSIPQGSYASTWPEWAYGVAEGALHFKKKVFVTFTDLPFGSNLLAVSCTNVAIPG